MQDRRRQFDEIFLQRTVGPYIGVSARFLHRQHQSFGVRLPSAHLMVSEHDVYWPPVFPDEGLRDHVGALPIASVSPDSCSSFKSSWTPS